MGFLTVPCKPGPITDMAKTPTTPTTPQDLAAAKAKLQKETKRVKWAYQRYCTAVKELNRAGQLLERSVVAPGGQPNIRRWSCSYGNSGVMLHFDVDMDQVFIHVIQALAIQVANHEAVQASKGKARELSFTIAAMVSVSMEPTKVPEEPDLDTILRDASKI